MSTIKHDSIGQVLAAAVGRLWATSPSASADAEILLCHVLGCNRSHLVAWPEKPLSPEQHHRYHELIEQRAAGRPVAHLTGVREFWSLSLKVDEYTLIPRPETETLVEFVLERFDTDDALGVADLGTGSGAIACALASERPGWIIYASDLSAEALAVARGNAKMLGLHNIRFFSGDWFNAFDELLRFDLIISNPPYIGANDPHLSQGDVIFEPASALVSGEHGLDDIRLIARHAPARLKPGGWLVLEHGYDQQRAVATILHEAGFGQIEQRRDLAGIVRMTAGGLMPPDDGRCGA